VLSREYARDPDSDKEVAAARRAVYRCTGPHKNALAPSRMAQDIDRAVGRNLGHQRNSAQTTEQGEETGFRHGFERNGKSYQFAVKQANFSQREPPVRDYCRSAALIKPKYRLALCTSLAICSRSASTDGNFTSERRRFRKNSSSGVSGKSAMG